MPNILLNKLPESVQVSGTEYPVNWGYRANILIEIAMFSTRSDEQKLLDALNIFYLRNIPPDMDAAIKQMIWFFYCGRSPKKENGAGPHKLTKRSYDFEIDAPLIYAAFRAQYGINLNRTLNNDLHWWEFSAMFDSLDEKLKISRIMYYRTTDLDGMSKNQKKFIKKMRTLYAIPSGDETLDDKAKLAKRNADMKDAIYNCDGASAQMAETMQDNLQGKLTVLKSAAEGLGIEIYESIQQPLTDLAGSAAEALSQLTEAFESGGTEGLIEAGMQILNNVLLGIAQAAPGIIETALNTIESFVTNLDANLPQIMEAGGKILSSLIGGVISLLPALGTLAYDLITNLLTSITQNSDSIIQSGAETLVSFIEGCASKIPDLLSMAVDAVISLAMSLTDPNTLSNIIDAGIKLLVSLVQGITDAIPKLIAAVPKIIANLVAALIANIPRLLVASAEIMLQLGKYMIKNVANMLLAVPRIFKGLYDAFTELDWGNIGRNIIDGIKDGILNAAKNLAQAAAQAAKAALDAAKNFLGIHSPSRVMRDVIGKNMIAGINVGMEDETPELEKQSKSSAQAAVDAMKKTSAEEFVMEMQQKALLISNDAAKGDEARYKDNEPDVKGTPHEPVDYDRMGVEMKKAMNGMAVNMDGKKVGKLVAPTVDDEIGRINERKT